MKIDVDWLANVIRSVDGNNQLGAGALAEKIAEALANKDDPASDDDGWIPWGGGECPIPEAKAGEYEVKFENVSSELLTKRLCIDNYAASFNWGRDNSALFITAYRLIKP
jgi:hypothetical protein